MYIMQERLSAFCCEVKLSGMMLVQAEHVLGADPRAVCTL